MDFREYCIVAKNEQFYSAFSLITTSLIQGCCRKRELSLRFFANTQ